MFMFNSASRLHIPGQLRSALRTSIAAYAFSALAFGVALADESPGLGEPLSADAVAELNYVVMPDGSGLPVGGGSAVEGQRVFETHCIACHGEAGEGGINDRLAGGHGSLASAAPVRTVGSYWPHATTVFDYVRRAMPYQQPDLLSDDDVYAVTAYLLYVNGIVEEDERLDAESLPAVRMPNQDGFTWAWRPDASAAEN